MPITFKVSDVLINCEMSKSIYKFMVYLNVHNRQKIRLWTKNDVKMLRETSLYTPGSPTRPHHAPDTSTAIIGCKLGVGFCFKLCSSENLHSLHLRRTGSACQTSLGWDAFWWITSNVFPFTFDDLIACFEAVKYRIAPKSTSVLWEL
jgi:hypothetical protein